MRTITQTNNPPPQKNKNDPKSALRLANWHIKNLALLVEGMENQEVRVIFY